MNITQKAAARAIEDAGLDPGQLYMYGAECIGITGTPGDATKFLLALAANGNAGLATELADKARTDSMGLNTITYWPGCQIGA
jgi:hypothetical protein